MIALSDEGGKLEESYRYAPYGEAYKQNHLEKAHNQSVNPIRFAGRYLDSTSDLYSMRARDYDASTGRFLQTDPIECSSGSGCASSYIYAEDRPTALVDPSGEKAMGVQDISLPGPKTVNVTFFVYGMPWRPRNTAILGFGGWRWESLKGSGGNLKKHFVCHWDPARDPDEPGYALPWVYDDTNNELGRRHGDVSDEKNRILECGRLAFMPQAIYRQKSAYVYKAAYWGRGAKALKLDIVKRYYAELYDSEDEDPRSFLNRWNYSLGSPTVAVNHWDPEKIYSYVVRVCMNSGLPSGGWMSIWNGHGQGSGSVTPEKLERIEDALDMCTLGSWQH